MIDDQLKIIQLTDCHLLADPKKRVKGWDTYSLLQETIDYISNHERNIDLLLLTGDVSQDGSLESYQRALNLLSNINTPISALPGNHDDFSNMQIAFESTITCEKVIDLKTWRVLLLNSCQANKTAGRLTKSELKWLEGELQQGGKYPTLIAMHHYPLAIDSRWMDKIGLENGPEFLQLIAQYQQVKAVISGHIHQNISKGYRQIQIMGCPSSCYQFLPKSQQFALDNIPQGYRWLELEKNGHINTGAARIENT